VELVVLIFEIRHVKAMRKLKMTNFEKITEIQRRRKYNKKVSFTGIISLIALLVIIIFVSIVGDGRECAEKQALQNAVCIDCAQESCLDCVSGEIDGCKTCDKGFILNK